MHISIKQALSLKQIFSGYKNYDDVTLLLIRSPKLNRDKNNLKKHTFVFERKHENFISKYGVKRKIFYGI